jgi:hypothetical protein
VALPEHIVVRFTEEDAEYLSVRPVQQQTFRLHELVDMILSVTGKDRVRVQHILRAGSLIFHFYRYRWEGFEAPEEELDAVLAAFPDADVSRAFAAESCVAVILASGQAPLAPGQALLPGSGVEVARDAAQKKKLFSTQTLWDALMECARAAGPRYADYSYARRADIFLCELSPEQTQSLLASATKLAARDVRARLERCAAALRLFLLCPRSE